MKNLNKLNDILTKMIENIKRDFKKAPELNKIAEEIAKDVKARTRLGYGVKKEGASKKSLKGLKRSTIKTRKYLKKRGKLSSLTSPTKSNLTQTGEMVESVEGKAIGTKITVQTDSKNEKKAEYAAENGREFLNLSKNELNSVREKMRNLVISLLKKNSK